MGANSYHKKKLSLLVKQLEIYFILLMRSE